MIFNTIGLYVSEKINKKSSRSFFSYNAYCGQNSIMPNVGIPMPNLVPDRISGIQIVSHQLLRVGEGGFYVPMARVLFPFR